MDFEEIDEITKITENQEFINLTERYLYYSGESGDSNKKSRKAAVVASRMLAMLKNYTPGEADKAKELIYYMLGELSSYGSSAPDKREMYDEVFIPKLKSYKLLLEKQDSDTASTIESVLTKLKKDERKSTLKDFLIWLMVMIGIIIALFILLNM